MEVTLNALLVVVAVHAVVAFVIFKFVKGKFNVRKKYSVPSPNGAVVITGAASGIGRAAAIQLANQGHQVFAGFRSLSSDRDQERINSLKNEVTSSSNIIPVAIDVTDQESISRAVEEVIDTVGENGVVGLINSAGLNIGPYPVEFVDPDLLTKQMDVNVTGQVRVVQAFLPLIRQATGRIVFMSSVAGKISGNFQGPYAASKHALEAIADSLRRELSPWNISVSVINAGEISTPLLSSYDKEAARAKAKLGETSDTAVEYYGAYYDNYKPTKAKFVGNVNMTNKAILHSLSAPYPKTRYTVASKPMIKYHLYPPVFLGLPSWSVVPDRFLDKQMAKSQWPRRLKVH
jgi:NAD(P)-dependent dehydrogenase (short-subunit alcohol dehydrogenase family)